MGAGSAGLSCAYELSKIAPDAKVGVGRVCVWVGGVPAC